MFEFLDVVFDLGEAILEEIVDCIEGNHGVPQPPDSTHWGV